jgi:ADP-heptose:LPS heptosyltransferase
MPKVASILVVRLSAIGDLILVAPITAQLASEGHRVTLLCKDAYRSVATCLPGVHEVLSWEKDRAGIKAGAPAFEQVIDLQGTSKSKRWCSVSSIARYSRIKSRIYVVRCYFLPSKSPLHSLQWFTGMLQLRRRFSAVDSDRIPWITDCEYQRCI